GLINAINMCDGIDGLAGSLVLIALSTVALLGWSAGNDAIASRALIVISAIMVFMFFNMRFPWQSRARLFLGNGGSALLGYTLAWFLYRLTQNPQYPVNPAVAPYLIAIPLIDCLALMARRISKGRSPFRADRNHLHHLLLDAGFAVDRVTLLLLAASMSMVLFALLTRAMHVPTLIMVWVFVGVTLAY
ncbi:undecaprenyl-phosphate alpha-N-acetylglucosaminyl 1-phosphatetransferase, partial [mine drainage metagenome]